ncbi:MAG: hypothetical protein ACREON_14950, partial [Gemmatimonadaceae bacterium]
SDWQLGRRRDPGEDQSPRAVDHPVDAGVPDRPFGVVHHDFESAALASPVSLAFPLLLPTAGVMITASRAAT